jgi:hypothetical protein
LVRGLTEVTDDTDSGSVALPAELAPEALWAAIRHDYSTSEEGIVPEDARRPRWRRTESVQVAMHRSPRKLE